MNMKEVIVIGAGLAGVEAAYYLANNNVKVTLYEMRGKKQTPAHKTNKYAELVCSNSLRSDSIDVASGALKKEMEMLNSLVIKVARNTQVEAGSALAVCRESFSEQITKIINEHPNITVVNDEITSIDTSKNIVIATGPLTSDDLSKEIKRIFGDDDFYFFDAAAPIVTFDSINMDVAYLKSRYDKGVAAYINCPMTKEEYEKFHFELINAEEAELHDFDLKVFEGCMPVEVMAKRGRDTLLYGPLKPMGLMTPDGKKPYAVVQLRQDDAKKTLYNLVGFQTHLRYPEQKRVFRLIPGLENAEFVKYGLMHKNTYINSPKLLNASYQSKEFNNIFFCGQMTGVEGYVESAASGIYAGINMLKHLNEEKLLVFPQETIMGSMAHYITHASKSNFQPMNANFGILPSLEVAHKKKERKGLYGQRAIDKLKEYMEENGF
ncbi:MAG: methylenetetrahydrofolate--tRNA-(uracil(54)-C(5))-methyltransferase (FADH(2)-oxidizing) TrmFO [bacterium]